MCVCLRFVYMWIMCVCKCACACMYICGTCVFMYVFEGKWNACVYLRLYIYMQCACDFVCVVHVCLEVYVLVLGTCVMCSGKTVGVCTWSADGGSYLKFVCVYVYFGGKASGAYMKIVCLCTCGGTH